ncbi:hypothetical protein [Niveibacterium sp. SC-1]|uniref:hypothetical protein n=1 Tax=Niveibacterium sp. SC-1 TaxID=3135646 RepID=UPI00311D5365
MDPVTLAGTAVAVLAPYLGKAAEKFAGAAGDAAWKKAGEFYDALKTRLAGHPGAADALTDLAATPADPDAQAALRQALKKLIASDPDFARELAALSDQAAAPPSVGFHNMIQGNVTNLTQAGNVGTLNISGNKE